MEKVLSFAFLVLVLFIYDLKFNEIELDFNKISKFENNKYIPIEHIGLVCVLNVVI